MRIIFSGGGTLGPVTPLLATAQSIQQAHPNADFLWVGTKQGPERVLVEEAGISFRQLSSGKFRRYISFWNVVDIFRIVIGFFQSLRLLWKYDPDVCISAGGFISVPLHWAAWFLGIPTWVHQQDVRVGLANKLMAPVATVITTALEQSVEQFSSKKIKWLGNPIRKDLYKGKKSEAKKLFGLPEDLPVVFATGGGTGSMKVNQMIIQAAQHLGGRCSIIHLTGKERPQDLIAPASRQFAQYYKAFPFFSHEMKHAYAIADIVISRAGFGTLTEVAALSKATILIPKVGHQEENAHFLEKQHAVIVLPEETSDGNHLTQQIKELLDQKEQRQQLAQQLHKVLPPATDEAIFEILDFIVHA